MKLSITFGWVGCICLFLYINIHAQLTLNQDGLPGINVANETISGYYQGAISMVYAIGALLTLIGAVDIYQKWNAGDPYTDKVTVVWIGCCVLLVLVSTVLKSFFQNLN